MKYAAGVVGDAVVVVVSAVTECSWSSTVQIV
jgi:hypothetical protein